MAFLGNTPHLETAAPFATPPTVIETSVNEVQKSLLSGVGAAFGMAIGGFILYHTFGRNLIKKVL
ncbi:hypothetical protein HOO68_05885 [Candidatus Gracilibacteria bacterium]|nr:hypothetical protein [Candidatus Gracilibacteria bacterium]